MEFREFLSSNEKRKHDINTRFIHIVARNSTFKSNRREISRIPGIGEDLI